jgi:general L-amino acid transport system permease protein
MTVGPAPAPARPPLWRDIRVLRIVGQAVALLLVGAFLAWLWNNLQTNVDDLGIPAPTDFSYLDQPVGQSIAGSDLRPTQSRLDALQVGLVRTIQIAIVGIILTTILGVLLGIARLSQNWLVATFARLYVELFRNTPPLVVIIFIYLGMFINGGFLPRVGDAIEIPNLLAADIRGISVLWVSFVDSPWPYVLVLAGGIAVAYGVAKWRSRVQDERGKPTYPGLSGFVVFLAIAIVGWLALGGPVELTGPSVADDGSITGGYKLTPEYAALLIGLVLYTASHVAEITRASIQAVARGQDEAAKALGLTAGQRLRKVILPQALRVAIPPLSNQYLNLTKNSSLAVAIAYVEMTRVTSDLVANGAPAFQAFLLLAFLYLLISLATALITNFLNARLAIPGR